MKKAGMVPIYFALLLSMLAMSISAPMNKLAMAQGMPSAVINFWRLGIASLCTFPFVVFTTRGRQDAKLLFRTPKDILLIFASGLFLSMHFYTSVLSMTFTSAFGSVVLVSAHPIFTLLGDRVFFGQRYSKKSLAGVSISLLGIVLVGGNSLMRQGGNITGDLLALLGAIMFSGYMLVGRELRSRYAINTYTTGVYGVSAIILALIAIASGLRFAPYPMLGFTFVGCIIVTSTFLGHSLVNWTLGYLSPSKVSIVLLLGPIMTGIWSYLLLREIPSILLFLGGLVTVLGLICYLAGQVWEARRRTNHDDSLSI